MQDGEGTFTWANGAVYEGEWKDNKRNGHGFTNGVMETCTKENGRITSQTAKALLL